MNIRTICLVCLLAASAFGAGREVVITIDDLPRGGDGGGQSFEAIREMTVRLLKPFQEQKIPLAGFVNSGRTSLKPPELRKILDLWLDAGAQLGNHTATHPDLNKMPVEDYEQDILNGEAVVKQAVNARGMKFDLFRFPFLHAGPTPEAKHAVERFLAEHGYRNAPVTFDDSDYMFAVAYLKPALKARVRREYVPYLESVVAFFEQRSQEVVGRDFPQIILLHVSEMNSYMLPQILAMFRARGYRFVSLDYALKDDAYRLPDDYAGPGGFSWIHRWSKTKGMPSKGEPDEPDWVRKQFQPLR